MVNDKLLGEYRAIFIQKIPRNFKKTLDKREMM